MKVSILSISIIAAMFCTGAKASIYESLTAAEQAVVQKGGQVVKTIEVDNSAWPKVAVFQRLEATPEETMAVFYDYPIHSKIFPRITKSDPRPTSDKKITEIDYTMSLSGVPGGVLPDENYTTKNTISAYDGGLRCDWGMVRADNIKYVEGWFKVESLGSGTILAYYNFIIPHKPELARLITKMAVKQVKETVSALGNQILKERQSDQAKLQQQLASLKAALAN